METNGGLLMVYDNAVRGQYALGVARNDDGAQWSPAPSNPLLTPTTRRRVPRSSEYELVRGPDGLLFVLEVGAGSTSTDLYAYRLVP